MVAFAITEFNYNWAAKLAGLESSTTEEVTAVTQAFTFVINTPSKRPYVIVCVSR